MDQYLTWQQVQSFFSREASSRRRVAAAASSERGSKEQALDVEVDVSAIEHDVLFNNPTAELEDIVEQLMDEGND